MSVRGALESPSLRKSPLALQPSDNRRDVGDGVLPAPVPVPLRRLREKARHPRDGDSDWTVIARWRLDLGLDRDREE